MQNGLAFVRRALRCEAARKRNNRASWDALCKSFAMRQLRNTSRGADFGEAPEDLRALAVYYPACGAKFEVVWNGQQLYPCVSSETMVQVLCVLSEGAA